ncbi:hypothetical protein FEE59_25705, partial [Herbaspirillum sp. RU 5E]|nr:hypothetical protein [Herbaspirillum sp. RU 5E]
MNTPTTTVEQSTNNEATAESAREKWRSANSTARRHYMSNSQFFVRHPQCASAINEIRLMAAKCKLEGKGKGLLTMGGSGAGKTYLA